MRRIKFRGKGLLPDYKGKWVYGYYKKYAHGKDYIEDEHGNVFLVDPETVSQLVFVADSGDEIYEGDIVKNFDDNSIWHVCWSPNKMGFTVALVKPGESDDTDFEMRWLEDCVVIGNIWDSDERLLKEEEK